MKNVLNIYAGLALCLLLLGGPSEARVYFIDPAGDDLPATVDATPRFEATQRNCVSLSEAVDRVRRQGNVERVISARTRISGGREIHHIKVLTSDGKVQTRKIPGC